MIKRLRVKNFKSLYHVDIPLQPLTVLVGPNASGKSNILDALAFLSEILNPEDNNTVRVAFQKRGGYGDVIWGGDTSSTLSFEVEGSVEFERANHQFTYNAALEQERGNMVIVNAESLKFRGQDNEVFNREGSSSYVVPGIQNQMNINPQEILLTNQMRGNKGILDAVSKCLALIHIYDFQRAKIAERQPVKHETRLNADGSNAATVLHWLRNSDVDTFERLENLLKAAIPEVEHLLTPPDENGKVYIAFKERSIPGRIPAWNLSEGSAKLVATLLALFAPTPPSLVAIEAPETALHPYLMEYLADILRLGSRETQIIITTHSPYLLNRLPPESLLLVTKENGKTKVKRPPKNRAFKESLKVLGLGELWYSGQLGATP